PLYAPKAVHGWTFTASSEAYTDGILQAIENGDELFEVSDPDYDFQTLETVDKRIFMPLRAGGFYRYEGLPLIDLIGHGAIVFADPFRINGGIQIEGSSFPLSILSAGIAHDEIAWRSTLGMRMNLHLLELGIQASLSSSEFLGMFSTRGFALNLTGSIGF
ncbi:MAG: hypothetical protein ACOCVC_02190, partial [Spirochaeta sp.]